MTATHVQELKTALSSMFDAIEKKENIVEHLLKIEDVQQQIETTAPAQLRHFLERRSYIKALEYLQSGVVIEDPNRPDCDDQQHHP